MKVSAAMVSGKVSTENTQKTSTARIKKFRQEVAALGYQRMEVVASVPVIKALRAVAKERKMATYEALELAVKLLVQWHTADVSGNGRAKS